MLRTADPLAAFDFDRSAWLAIMFSASDGLVIALVMKYADNILKGFATCIAICITAAVSVATGDTNISFQLVAGGLMVAISTYMYFSL